MRVVWRRKAGENASYRGLLRLVSAQGALAVIPF